MNLKNKSLTVFFLLTILGPNLISSKAQAQNDIPQSDIAKEGETIFNTTCAACHTIGSGRLVGPDLANINSRRAEKWIISFVQASQKLIAGGDADAKAIFEEYGKMPMPDQNLSDFQIHEIIEYIKEKSPTTISETKQTEMTFTADETLQGSLFFSGKKSFVNKGTPCLSCHTVDTNKIISGGSLAKNLSSSYKNLKFNGVQAILKSPTFPAMRQTYQNNPLNDEEIKSLAAFLSTIENEQPNTKAKSYENILLGFGILGAFILFGMFAVFGRNRKKDSVNK